jgi:ATP-binding cassette subfamily F protein uup
MSSAPLISLQDATKGFSERPLFTQLTLVISVGERVALIGDNGCGKSTLLKILAGLEELDSGTVSCRKGLRSAYVAQQDRFPDDLSVAEVLERALGEAHLDHSEVARRSSRYLGMAGFLDPEVSVSTLSGGWKKRLSIATALALEPDCLLLDEPTNHLDIDSIEWLEEVLAALPIPVVFVSHDRYFIEKLATRVIELNSAYPRDHIATDGGYADYIEKREVLLSQLQQQRSSLANKVRREVEWLRQGVKARTTKSRARINEAHRLIDTLRSTPSTERQRVELEFSSTQRKTKELLKAEGVAQSIAGQALFKNLSLVLSPGSRLGIVGANGSGKTTLVRTLLGELPPTAGRILRAPNLRVSFLDQARSQIREEQTLREFLCPHGDSVSFQRENIYVAAWAARFLFSHNHLARRMIALSGGERARALLAKSITEESDILVFDEPTNDLDIATLENLEEGFESFPGALVLITHDRYILERTAHSVLGLLGGEAVLFGSYGQWESYKQEQSARAPSLAAPSAKGEKKPTAERAAKKLSYKDARDLSLIEAWITEAEAELAKIQQQLDSSTNATDATKLTQLCEQLITQQQEIEKLYARWEELEKL